MNILFILLALTLTGCSGSGGVNSVVDIFKVQNTTYNSQVDILWVIDSSYAEDQTAIAQHMNLFFSQLVSLRLDYRVATMTMDMQSSFAQGRFVGTPKVIDTATWDLESAFSQQIQPGVYSHVTPQPFDALLSGLSVTNLMDENKNFLRDDALLVIIFVSKNTEQSHSLSTDVISHLQSLKGKNWVAHSLQSDCSLLYQYHDITTTTKGISTCSAIPTALSQIRQSTVEEVTKLNLDKKPELDTLVVTMNGRFITESSENGWSYSENENHLRFHGDAIPAADTIIKVTYSVIP